MAKVVFISTFDECCKGIRYLMSAARLAGHEAHTILLKTFAECRQPIPPRNDDGYYGELFHVTEEELHLTCKQIKTLNPDIIGISVFSHYHGVCKWLTKHLRREFPSLPILWGGVDVTYNPDTAIQHADLICISDGEGPIVDILDAIQKGKDFSDIDNLWVRGKDGSISKRPPRPLDKDISSLPIPAYSPENFWEIKGSTIKPFAPSETSGHFYPHIMATRGCPSACTYCYPSAHRLAFKGEPPFRTTNVPRVIEEIGELLKYYPWIPYLKIADDVFGQTIEWAREFKVEYRKRFNLTFRSYIHPTITKPAILAELKEAGMEVACIGVQSGSERILKDVYHRPFYPPQVMQKFKEIRDLDLWVVFDLILFNPIEDETDLRATFDLVCNLPRPFGFPFLGTLMIFENFPLIRILRERNAGIRRLDDSNTFFADQNLALHEFYYGLIGMACMQSLPLEITKRLQDDTYFRNNPTALVHLMRSYLQQEMAQIDEIWVPRDKLMDRMAREIVAQRGSRLHQIAERVRSMRHKTDTPHFPCPYVDNLPTGMLKQLYK